MPSRLNAGPVVRGIQRDPLIGEMDARAIEPKGRALEKACHEERDVFAVLPASESKTHNR